jgi:LPS export ABC transporter protein LptC
MIFRVLTTILFIAIIAGSFWLGGQQREAPAPASIDSSNTDLGYSARNAILTETGPDGLPLYTIDADVIRQHPADGVDFDQVKMSFRDQTGQIWTAHALRGELSQDTSQVELSGDAHIDGMLPGSTAMTDLATEKLSVDTQAQIIRTDEPVVVTSIGRVLRARGMVATLKEHHLVFQSSVHGTFLPSN